MTRRAVIGYTALTIVFVIQGTILGHGIQQNRKALNQLKRTKADISQLQQSNCSLKKTLLDARLNAYNRAIKRGQTKKQAKITVASLTTIIVGLDGERYCPTPKKFILK